MPTFLFNTQELWWVWERELLIQYLMEVCKANTLQYNPACIYTTITCQIWRSLCKQLRKTQHFPRNDDGSWQKGTKFNFGWRWVPKEEESTIEIESRWPTLPLDGVILTKRKHNWNRIWMARSYTGWSYSDKKCPTETYQHTSWWLSQMNRLNETPWNSV